MLQLLLLTATSEVIAQMCIKQFQVTGHQYYMFFGMILYSIICWCLLQMYKLSAIGIVQALWSSMSIIFSLVLGVILFNDKVTKIDCIGALFIIFGAFIILYKSN